MGFDSSLPCLNDIFLIYFRCTTIFTLVKNEFMKRKANLEASPLLSSRVNSTINPDRLDQTRFTDIQQSVTTENSSARIIIYIVIVIAIGIGAALFVRNMSTTQTEEPDNTEQEQETPAVSTFKVSSSILQNSAATNSPKDSDFISSLSSKVGDTATAMTTAKLEMVSINKFQSFDRIELKFSTAKLPSTTNNFAQNKKSLSIPLTGIIEIAEDIKSTMAINNVITQYKFNSAVPEIILEFTDAVGYRLLVQGNTLVIDLKKDSVSLTPVVTPTTPEPEEEVVPETPVADGSKPAAPFYTNAFGKTKQYISSAVTGATIAYNNYFVYDANSYFEFSFGANGLGGDAATPNATAEYVTESGKNFIEIVIENLSSAPFQVSRGKTAAQIEAETGLSVAGGNFVAISLLDFVGGKATYRIEVKNKADFKLLVQEWIDASTDVLSIQIKD